LVLGNTRLDLQLLGCVTVWTFGGELDVTPEIYNPSSRIKLHRLE
jgi:hypothetical protein